MFNEAREAGVNRTVHAGEVGPAKCVQQALDVLHAQRIGIDKQDKQVYKLLEKLKQH